MWVKRILKTLAAILILTELWLVATGNLFVNKVIWMTLLHGKMGPDINELELFPKHEVKATTPQPWPVSSRFGMVKPDDETIEKFKGYQTVSFLVVSNDSLLYEYFDEGYGNESYINSFSMAKSINAILIGCALKEGLIKSIDDPVSDYIEEFKNDQRKEITIRHLLTMTSGIDFKEDYVSPLAWPAEAYYGPDVNTLTLKALPSEKPGLTWYYKGGDSQLLGIILEKVLKGKTIANYASEKLWQRIGAEHNAYWSTDEKGMEKVSCCFYTNARDYARIAKLYLQKGNWNGVQIVDSSYVEESVKAAPALDRKGLPNEKYGFQWWLMKHQGHDIFYMRGIRGQYVFAVPDLNIVVVRLGHKRAPKAGDDLPADVFVYLDAAFKMAK